MPGMSAVGGNRLFFFLQNIVKYLPFSPVAGFRAGIFRPFFKYCGRNVRIMDGVTIKYPDEIELGDDVTLNQNCFLAGKGGLKIGNQVMVGAGCKITASQHRHERTDIPMLFQGIACERVIIGDDVWLGFNCIILPGARVGTGVIVGAGAVVPRIEVEPYSIIGGVPARVIGHREGGQTQKL